MQLKGVEWLHGFGAQCGGGPHTPLDGLEQIQGGQMSFDAPSIGTLWRCDHAATLLGSSYTAGGWTNTNQL